MKAGGVATVIERLGSKLGGVVIHNHRQHGSGTDSAAVVSLAELDLAAAFDSDAERVVAVCLLLANDGIMLVGDGEGDLLVGGNRLGGKDVGPDLLLDPGRHLRDLIKYGIGLLDGGIVPDGDGVTCQPF